MTVQVAGIGWECSECGAENLQRGPCVGCVEAAERDAEHERAATAGPDVQVIDGGSVIGFRLITKAARDWFDEHVYSQPWQWMGPTLYVDYRFAEWVYEGLLDQGFEVGP